MSYYRKSGPYKGDYYRGDYYRGDVWDDIVGTLSNVSDFAAATPLGSGIQKLGQWLIPGAGRESALTAPGSAMVAMPFGGMSPFRGSALPAQSGGPSSPSIVVPGGAGRVRYRRGNREVEVLGARAHRRMNVCNPRALRRALRRSAGFLKFAKHFIKLSHPHASVTMKHTPHKKHRR